MNGLLQADRNGSPERWLTPQLSSVAFATAQAEGRILGVGPIDTGCGPMSESGQLNLDRRLTELLDAACAHRGAVSSRTQPPCDSIRDRPMWVWVMCLFVVAWAVWYAARMWNVPPAYADTPTYRTEVARPTK
jgi:hypothetical protein